MEKSQGSLQDASAGLGLLRLFAMILVLLFHAAFPYSAIRDTSFLYLIYEPESSALADGVIYVTRGIHMPLFFLLAGCWAEYSFRKSGGRRFLLERCKRLLVPLLIGLFTILPLTYGVVRLGMRIGAMQGVSENQWRAFPSGLPTNLVKLGFAHLWYLEYLFLITMGYAALRWCSERWSPGLPGLLRLSRMIDCLWQGPSTRALLAIPTFLLLWASPSIWTNMYPSLVPSAVRLTHYAVFFVAGTSLARLPDLTRLASWSSLLLLLSIPGFAAAWYFGSRNDQVGLPALAAWQGASVALSTWLAVCGLLGLSLRFRELPRWAGLMFDASFWTYWSHMPVVGLLHIGLFFCPLPGMAKLVIAAGLTLITCLLGYRALRRYPRALSLLERGTTQRLPHAQRRAA